MEQNASNYITMIDRAFEIIEYVALSPEPVGVSRIAKDLGLPKSNAFRILNTLCKWDALEEEYEDKYSLGKAMIKYGNIAKDRIDLTYVATPIVKELSKEIGETVNLGVVYEHSMLTIVTCQGEFSTLVSKLVPISPMYCSSQGKIFLANAEDQSQIKKYYENLAEEDRKTMNTIIEYDVFMSARDKIKESNLAYDEEEYEYGLSCIATGIKDKDGKVVAALSLSGPTSRLAVKDFQALAEKIKAAGEKISEQMKIIG